MRGKEVLQIALEYIQHNRYADSSLYLADFVASLAFGGNHRRVDLSRFSVLDEKGQELALDLIKARAKGSNSNEVWERMADKMLETTKGG